MKRLSDKKTDGQNSINNSGSNNSNNNTNSININGINNNIKKYFTFHNQTGSYGVELTWRIFSAVRTSNTKEEVSVFYFEKKIGEKLHKPRRRETVCESLRRDYQCLMSVSHSKLLRIVHPLEENSESMAFATERVHCSLANVLGNYTRMDSLSCKELHNIELNELNIKHGIYQIAESLRYLNTSLQYSHNNCSPYTILISNRNGWKLAGMAFAEKYASNQTGNNLPVAWSTKTPKMAQPNLDFIAPEIQLEARRSETSDMFSFGLVICSIYASMAHSLIDSRNSLSIYMERINRLPVEYKDIAHKIPEELQIPLEKMLSLDVKLRPNSQLFSLLKYFNDPVLLGLETLLNLIDQQQEQRLETLTSLKGVICKLPQDILYKSAFKILINQLNQSERDEYRIIADLLGEIIRISSIHTFDELLEKDIINVLHSFTSINDRIDFLCLADPLLSKMNDRGIKDILMPFIFNEVTCSDSNTQILFFDTLKSLRQLFCNKLMMNKIMKIIEDIYNQNCDESVLLSIINCLAAIAEQTDGVLLESILLPFLLNIKYDKPTILIACINIFKSVLSQRPDSVDCRFIACELMQKLVPETVNPRLKIIEFKILMEILHLMLDKIDKEYWKSHSSPNMKIFENDENQHQVPKIQMLEFGNQSKLSSSNYGRRESQDFLIGGTVYKDDIRKDGHNVHNLTQPQVSVNAKSSPSSPLPLQKHDTESKINFGKSGGDRGATLMSLNVPLNSGRRHSFGSSSLLQQSVAAAVAYGDDNNNNTLITASVCEGPFFAPSSSNYNSANTQSFHNNSRRPSATFVPPSFNQGSSRKGSSDNLTVIPITRRSSFNALSDTVMNLFHS